MALNGIGISSAQAGMDVSKVNADFVIVKATQGVTYVNPYCNKHYAQAKASGKLRGLYHYAEGGIRVIIRDIMIEELVEKLKAKLDEVAVKTDGDETVYSLKNATLGNVITKDIAVGNVEFTLKPQTAEFYIAQNKADIEAINEAIADLAASVGGE